MAQDTNGLVATMPITAGADAAAETADARAERIMRINDSLNVSRMTDAQRQLLADSKALFNEDVREQAGADNQSQQFASRLKTLAGGEPCQAAFKLFGSRPVYARYVAAGGSCSSRQSETFRATQSLVRDAIRELVRSGVLALSPKAQSDWATSFVITGKFFSTADMPNTPLARAAVEALGEISPVVEYDGDLDADRGI